MDKYNSSEIEKKWQEVWEKNKLNEVDIKRAKKPFYNLWMFPYPSAEGLHVGHAFASTASDVYGRFKRLQGYDVFEPIGYDSFGIHSENFALKIGEHPKKFTDRATKNYERQLRAMGHMYDWSRTVTTSSPDYYKWTQWVFLQMYKKGLAYRGKALVNWCPTCKTVLSDEQVIDGKCERTGDMVEKKEMEQWFFKITAYADRLLANLDSLDWTAKIKTTQKNWIGKKEWIDITYPIDGRKETVTVSTTRPDTNFGATFIVVAPEHELVTGLAKSNKEIKDYVEKAQAKTEEERIAEGRKKTGVFTGLHAVNQLNGAKMPIWVADFALTTVGTGAVVGVPGHDRRDFEFATEFGLPIVRVVVGKDGDKSEIKSLNQVQEEEGTIVNSDFLDGLDIHEATKKIMDFLEDKGWGKRTMRFHLRDWLISRQRYWGPPIPMIFCASCVKKGLGARDQGSEMDGWYPVAEDQLPVLLPDIADYQPKGDGKGPLANHPEFYKTKCPKCGGEAERETDVSDTFLDSAWYELRYPSTSSASSGQVPFDREITKKWLPVNMYTGGAEHAVLHLMYFRFVTMVLKDLGYVDFEEPTKSFFAHGLIIKDGAKMSKSRGNVVNPDEYITKYGADALRLYFMFMGPAEQGGDFRDAGMAGMRRWVEKVNRIIGEQKQDVGIAGDEEVETELAGLVKKATEGLEARRYNVVIAGMMEFLNFVVAGKKKLAKDQLEAFLIIFSVFAPHLAEELWQSHRNSGIQERSEKSTAFVSVHQQVWPEVKTETKKETITLAISIDGKTRATQTFGSDDKRLLNQDQLVQTVQTNDSLSKYLIGKVVKKVIYVPGKIVNFVTEIQK